MKYVRGCSNAKKKERSSGRSQQQQQRQLYIARLSLGAGYGSSSSNSCEVSHCFKVVCTTYPTLQPPVRISRGLARFPLPYFPFPSIPGMHYTLHYT